MLKTSIIQFRPEFADIPANTAKVNKLLSSAKKSDLVVLPELANTGYNFINKEQALSLAEKPEKSEYVDMLTDHAVKNKQIIVSGYHELEKNKLYNTSLLITEEGIVGKYRKVHLFMHEKTIFEAGNLGFPVFNVKDIKLGMLICFDYLFSEAWRILGLKGADIVAHPSNLITQNATIVVPAQALMNRLYVLTANRTGTERSLTFNGRSFAAGPDGRFVMQLKHDRETVKDFEIDPLMARDKFITPLNHVFEDRFPGQYKEMLKKNLT